MLCQPTDRAQDERSFKPQVEVYIVRSDRDESVIGSNYKLTCMRMQGLGYPAVGLDMRPADAKRLMRSLLCLWNYIAPNKTAVACLKVNDFFDIVTSGS
jgi:hypothetical protein